MDSENDLLVNSWLAQIEAGPSTKKLYGLVIKKYSEFTGKTPLELIEGAEKEILGGVLMRKRKIRQYLLGYQEHLKDGGKAPTSIRTFMAAVRSFYKVHDIDLPNLKSKPANPLESNGSRARLSIKDIRKLFNYAKNLRDKAIILTIVSSGLGSYEVRDLRIRHLHNVDDDGVCTLELTRSKVNCEFTTFLSPEAMEAINEHLTYRNTKSNLSVKGNDDYVFTNESGKKLTGSAFMEIFRSIGIAAGFKNKSSGEFNLARAHNLRKFFNSQLINNGADIFFTDYLMGHKIDGTRAAYFKADPEKLKVRYIRFLPYLTVEETRIKIVESSEYKKLKEENVNIKKQLDEINTLLTGIMRQQNNDVIHSDLMKELHTRDPELLKSRFGIDDEEYQRLRDVQYNKLYGMTESEHEKDNAQKKKEFFDNLTEDEINELLYGPLD